MSAARDELADLIAAHWLKTREGVGVNGSPTVVGVCYCGIESVPQFFDWRVWHWHNQHLADAILAAGWVSPQHLADVERLGASGIAAEARAVHEVEAERDALAAQVQRVRDRCAFWADAGDAEADIATDILTAIINDGEGEA